MRASKRSLLIALLVVARFSLCSCITFDDQPPRSNSGVEDEACRFDVTGHSIDDQPTCGDTDKTALLQSSTIVLNRIDFAKKSRAATPGLKQPAPCPYTNDGECDEPTYCAVDTDIADCTVTNPTKAPVSFWPDWTVPSCPSGSTVITDFEKCKRAAVVLQMEFRGRMGAGDGSGLNMKDGKFSPKDCFSNIDADVVIFNADPSPNYLSKDSLAFARAFKRLAFDRSSFVCEGGDDSNQLLLSSTTIGDAQSIVSVPRTFVASVNVPSGFGSGRVGVMAGSYPKGKNVNWEIHESGKPRLCWDNCAVDWKIDIDLRTGTWKQLAFVVNQAGTEAKFYVDGTFIESKTASFASIVPDGTILIGGDHRPGNTQSFKAQLGCVKIFGSELSASGIAQYCQAGN